MRRAAAAVVALLLAGLVVLGASGRVAVEQVLSGSMTPAYPLGCAVLLEPVAPAAVRTGDVVAAWPPDPFRGTARVMHRVVEVRHEGGRTVLQTKGDANVAADPWTLDARTGQLWAASSSCSALLGRAQRTLRSTLHGGGVLTWLGVLLLVTGGGAGPAPVRPARPVRGAAGTGGWRRTRPQEPEPVPVAAPRPVVPAPRRPRREPERISPGGSWA